MTFAEVLPHVAAGKRVRRDAWPAYWSIGKTPDSDRWCSSSDIFSSDWTIVEELTPAYWGPCSHDCHTTIARLTRELAEAKRASPFPGQCKCFPAEATLTVELREDR